ncbi:peptidoglycan-binding protein [Kribbella sp. NPDC056345]|uniref:peptidoglycan-binding domain-containing protein n=1 Tax=Kribbella sp. NPDC056345 TaxID=3345789 RepID=UPI0035E25E5A
MRNILRRPRTRGVIVAAALAGSLVCGLAAAAGADVISPSSQAAPAAPTAQAAPAAAAEAAATAAASCSSTYLAYGSRGACVTQLQRNLGGIGVDGVYGSATRSRVRAFQADARIGVDGKVGPQTWRKLRTYGRAMAWAGGITLYMCELPSKNFRVSVWNDTSKWADWAYYMSDKGYPIDGEKIGPSRLVNQFSIYAGSYDGTSFTTWVGSSKHTTRRVVDISPRALPAC